MSSKKPTKEPDPKGPQKPAFDPGKSYPPKPHPQHPYENDPPEFDDDDPIYGDENQPPIFKPKKSGKV